MKITFKTYGLGADHYKWNVRLITAQDYDFYRYILCNRDDEYYIRTNNVSPSTANDIEDAILTAIREHESKVESISDLFEVLQKGRNGTMFHEVLAINPELVDGVILLAYIEGE